nr:RNA-directed DNA polymerase, eukaryota [Tanacetum cinerariifolium]
IPTGVDQANGQFQTGSYVNVVNGSSPVGVHGPSISSASVLVLDDSCVAERDLSNHVMEALDSEDNVDSSFECKRLCIKTKLPLSILKSFKVIFNGKVYMVRAKELITWSLILLGQKEMEYTSDEDSDVGPQKVPDRLQFCEEGPNDDRVSDVEEVSETNFGDNSLLRKQPGDESQEVSSSLSHPPGFTPDVSIIRNKNGQSAKEIPVVVNAKVMNNSQDVYKEASCDNVDPNVVKKGGSVLRVMEDMIRVGKAMGYSMDGCVKDLEQIIGTQGVGDQGGRELIDVVVLGDFNEVRNIDEMCGSCFNPTSARVFDQFISASGLVNVKMEGYMFTWSHPSGSKMSKLDRFLVYEGIFSIFPSIKTVCLDRHLSDHRPIILCEDLKVRIQAWIKDKRSSVSGEKDSIKKELSDIDRLLDGGDVFDYNLLRRSELHSNLYNINQMESKEYLQKSKIKWDIEGDENSKLFHGLINKKRFQLAICRVFIDGIWCTNPKKLKEAFFKHFEARFKKPVNRRLKINFLFSKRLSDVQASDLERRVSRDEIRKYWNLVDSNLCDAVEHFFETGSFPNGCNSSFVALILKITDAKFVNDYRPISLIGSVYKVVTKVLANRLALVILDLISDTQSAFVANRQILDGPFILNELLHWCKRKKKQVMFFKVDFAKAYDSIRWDYLLDVMEAFGFGNIWCKWIRGTFSFAKASVLVNGSQTIEFPFHCRLKQEDPLSLYLFILIMESLNMSFTRAFDEGVFKGVHLHGSTSISHLFYADDVMFIGEWFDDNLKGGRLTLLKAVLGASPLYNMFIFKVPKGILNSMEAIRSKFFNGMEPST